MSYLATEIKIIREGYGKILLEEREKSGITLETLAHKMHLPQSYLRAIELGFKSPVAHQYYTAINIIGKSALERAALYHLESSVKIFKIKRSFKLKPTSVNADALGFAFGFKRVT